MLLKDYFEEFLEYKRKEGRTEHTLKEYRRFLYGALCHCSISEKKLKDIRLTDLAEIKEAGREHGTHGETRATSCFRQLLKYLDENGAKLPFNWTRIRVPLAPEKEQDFLTGEEFEDFVNRLPDTFYGLRDRVIYEVLWATGLRIGELLPLNRNDIKDREAKIITEKTGNEEKVYFSERSLRWLDRYLKTRFDNQPALFVCYHQGINRLTRGQARKNLLNYRRKFGIVKNITHHCFRRSVATLLLERGADIKSVQYILRHKSERTTLKFYCKVNKRRAKEIHRKILDKGFGFW